MQMEQWQDQRLSLRMRLWHALLRWIDALLTVIRVPHQATETFLVGAIGIWAMAFFLNPNLFTISPVMYQPMSKRGDPSSWGWRAVLMVVLWMVAVRTHNVTLRYISQVLLIGWYFYLAALFLSTGVFSFGGGIHGLGFAYSVWVLWRFAGRKSDTP